MTLALLGTLAAAQQSPPRSVSGIYPLLSVWNQENECGVGAVVPWTGGLWLVTYAPHKPLGSTDKLYRVSPDLTQEVRPESVGGTPANRMIHAETEQLLMGPYVISKEGDVRVIPYAEMPGRPTGNARHFAEPERKVYYATMEEGLYEVDLLTLEVTEIFADGNGAGRKKESYAGRDLPGYHGKGLYVGQGRLVYANNGDQDPRVQTDPTTPSGALASWRPGDDRWTLERREQFTEVTGRVGISGGDPEGDAPIWTLGWDHRSLLLGLLEDGEWSYFRLPKASHSYDGAHGWNTEWPRIREIGEGDDFLATMHGTFWRFPATFSRGDTAGIRPRSSYLKVVGDFCRWGDRVVLGCDDVAASEFYNKRPQKSAGSRAGQAHSNLWFLEPAQLDELGPILGRGSLWMRDDVAAGTTSDPYLFAGYDQRYLHLIHEGDELLFVTLEADRAGRGEWQDLATIELEPGGRGAFSLERAGQSEWIRLRVESDAAGLTASLLYSGEEQRTAASDPIFAGVAKRGSSSALGGLLWNTGGDRRTLAVAVPAIDEAADHTLYELDLNLELAPGDQSLLKRTLEAEQEPGAVTELSHAWAWEERGLRFLFPKSLEPAAGAASATARVVREVATERDLLHIDGTFYELPSVNSGGVPYVRPIASHGLSPHDFASYAGLFVMSGVDPAALANEDEHVVASADGRAALWVGALDDLWKLGRPRGVGGPWHESQVRAGVPSDPYLLTGYADKQVTVSHTGDYAARITLQIDIDGSGLWVDEVTFSLEPRGTAEASLPPGLIGYWVRAVSHVDTIATVTLRYD